MKSDGSSFKLTLIFNICLLKFFILFWNQWRTPALVTRLKLKLFRHAREQGFNVIWSSLSSSNLVKHKMKILIFINAAYTYSGAALCLVVVLKATTESLIEFCLDFINFFYFPNCWNLGKGSKNDVESHWQHGVVIPKCLISSSQLS